MVELFFQKQLGDIWMPILTIAVQASILESPTSTQSEVVA